MGGLDHKFQVALYDHFLDSFAKLPKAQQKKTNKFLRKFRKDPTSASINFEKIGDFVDPNLRTVRIDQAYRAVVLKPRSGNVYVLLWVDHHDKAMAWAKNKKISIHPETGALQVLPGTEKAKRAPAAAEGEAKSVAAEGEAKSVAAEGGAKTFPADGEAKAAATAGEAKAAATEGEATSGPELASPKPASAGVAGLFDPWSDKELLSVGLPSQKLDAIRALTRVEQLDYLQESLPEEAFEALAFLAYGERLEDVRKALGMVASAQPEEIDTEDFEAALERDVSKRRFVVVEDDEALEAMLDAPLEKWRVFLHPSQRQLVYRDWNGPVRVLGGAGTGKTVVAMHRAVHLAQKVFTGEGDRILFTTFTKNLAADIRANLEKLCGPRALKRIEVVHLDKWVSDLLKRAGYAYRVRYWSGGDGGPGGELEKLWDEAMVLRPTGVVPESFYRDEWELVVQPNGCEDWESYRKVSRAGRGVRLSRKKRKQVWPVFEEYRRLLERKGLREPEDALRDAATMIERADVRVSYRAVIVDEAQDMSTNAFRLLRAVMGAEKPNDMFIVGDGHQRIYRKKVVLSHAGVNIRGRRGKRLRINYRTTDENRRFAVALLEGNEADDLDGGADTTGKYRSLMHGNEPAVRVFDTFDQELEFIEKWARQEKLSRTCLVVRTKKLLERFERELAERGVETYRIKRSEPEDPQARGLRLATMHRVKGLEFDRMILAGLSKKWMPLHAAFAQSEDAAMLREAELRERALFYVSATRARSDVLLTAHAHPSPWLPQPSG
jgi:hypothetical protein